MCGIIGYLGEKDAVPIIIDGLKHLAYRGYDSAGIAVIGKNGLELRRSVGKIANLEKLITSNPISGSCGVGHTRWATHGRPSEENAHPHRDCRGEIVVVHNGIIENYLSLRKELSSRGHKFITETDTEVIAHLIEENFTETLEEAVLTAIKKLAGVYALAVISTRDPGKIIGVKKGPPLVLGIGEGEYFLASDLPPLLFHTREVIFLDDGELTIITKEGIRVINFSGEQIKKETRHIDWDPVMAEKGGYRHFMQKEIHEQPRAVRDTILGRYSLERGEVILDEIGLSRKELAGINRIFIVACGTSWHASLCGKFMIEELARIPVEVDYGSEFRYRKPVAGESDLTIAITQSGETADTLAAMDLAKKMGSKVITICNVVGSMATRKADGVIYTHAGPEIGVASTKTFTAQLAALSLFALHLGQAKGILSSDGVRGELTELSTIPKKMEDILANAEEIELIARELFRFENFLYLGRGINYPIALEGALKLKEISYIHAEGYPAGEMKHGPIALIDGAFPVVAIAPRDRVYEKMLGNIEEVRARNGIVIVVANEEDTEIEKRADFVLKIPKTNYLLSPLLTAIPLQLLAYYIAIRRGCDVDQPRNLAKSVTVE
ncbi:MAG: glutamine--fructose-6-phosphate transaminase (isomerizing) [Acidobacteria bacterium]|nr:glutamine--fructose-6-phosphate transaminase (isomerizing) [Acidobacteriota bacterium]